MKAMNRTSIDAAVLCILASVTLLHAVSAAGGVVDKGHKPCPVGSYDENENIKFADVKCVSCEPFCRIGTIEFDLNCRRLCPDVFYDIMNPKQAQLPTELSHPNATKAANGTSNPAAVLTPDSNRPTTSMIIFIAVVSTTLLILIIVLVAMVTRRRCNQTKSNTVSDNERQGGNTYPQESIRLEEQGHLFNFDYDDRPPSVPDPVLDLHQPSIPESVSVV